MTRLIAAAPRWSLVFLLPTITYAITVLQIGLGAEQAPILGPTIRLQLQWAAPNHGDGDFHS
jgi:hypothetical protein